MSFYPDEFRNHFPQLKRMMGPKPLVYFDNGASTLKHDNVTDRLNQFNRFEVANVHRGSHWVSRQGTESFEGARKTIARLLNTVDEKCFIANNLCH